MCVFERMLPVFDAFQLLTRHKLILGLFYPVRGLFCGNCIRNLPQLSKRATSTRSVSSVNKPNLHRTQEAGAYHKLKVWRCSISTRAYVLLKRRQRCLRAAAREAQCFKGCGRASASVSFERNMGNSGGLKSVQLIWRLQCAGMACSVALRTRASTRIPPLSPPNPAPGPYLTLGLLQRTPVHSTRLPLSACAPCYVESHLPGESNQESSRYFIRFVHFTLGHNTRHASVYQKLMRTCTIAFLLVCLYIHTQTGTHCQTSIN